MAEEIAEAADRLSRAGTGAIIAVEGEVGLGDYLASGTPLSAKVSADLVTTIFTPYSPLHDGALIVRGDTIIGAGCILPLTQFPVDDKALGTRHRAALGLSEETDAMVIVISEETSVVSVARRGGPGARRRRRRGSRSCWPRARTPASARPAWSPSGPEPVAAEGPPLRQAPQEVI